METEDVLKTKFSEIGKEFGYDSVEAQFMAFKDLKIRWSRTYRWADFRVSDYFQDAPEEVMDGLCRSLYSKIGGTEDSEYPKAMYQWVSDPDFARRNQPVYIRRSRNISKTPKGESKDLSESYARIVEMGLAEKDDDIYLTWSRDGDPKKIGHCSVLMKVISINSVMDLPTIPDHVVDYCVYHELCHIIIGFDPTAEKHAARFADMIERFPQKKDAENWLGRLCVHV